MKRFLHFLITLAVFALSSNDMVAQSVTTESISFMIEDIAEIFMPPDLRVDVDFQDANGNKILEAGEKGKIRLNVINKGGKAYGVTVALVPESNCKGVLIPKDEFKVNIAQESSALIEVPLLADLSVSTGFSKINITVLEPNGYDINATVELSTFAYQRSKLTMNGVEISDSGKGLNPSNGNPDNKLQNNDVVRAAVLIQNIGEGQANGISYTITSKDPDIRLLTSSGYANEIKGVLSDMLVGQTEEITFRLSPNSHYTHKGGFVPVYLTVTEDMGFGNIVSEQIPIPFDEVAVKPEVVKVEGNQEKLLALLGTKVYSDDKRVNQENTLKDIMVVPYGESIHNNAVAIVMGSEDYMDKSIPAAPYAARDAEVMAEYFKKSMGIDDVRLMTDSQVTSMELKKLFDAKKGSLAHSVVPGVTELFLYYSGHGVPMTGEDGKNDIFLIPYDVDRNWIQEEGFSLNKLYSDLGSLRAKSVTVILDACFSGGSRGSETHESKSIANQKLAMADFSEMEQPWLHDTNFRVLTSSRGDQASKASDRSHSGLFTYWLAVGLQGDADSDTDGTITMKELADYVTVNVMKESEGTQTPQLHGNGEFVIEKIK